MYTNTFVVVLVYKLTRSVNLFFQLQSSNKRSRIQSFKDQSISTSLAVIDLIDAIKPGSVDYSLVTDGNTDEVYNFFVFFYLCLYL